MDALDRRIVGILRENARASWRTIGAQVGLSPNAAADRVRSLTRRGVVRRFTVEVDPGADGRSVAALVDVRLAPGADSEAFARLAAAQHDVDEVLHVTGRFDYHLRVACPDTRSLDELLRRLKREGRVAETETRVVLRSDVPSSHATG